MRILVFDTETSGLDPQWNVILQLSYQIVDPDSWATIKTVNHYFAWPDNKARVSEGAISVNGLTEEVLSGKQLSNRKAALEEFVADKDSCDLLVAHNLEFDKKFIIASCREEGVKFANSGWSQSYDTMKRTTNYCQIPKDWGNGYKWPKLTELADCLGVDYSNISLHDSSGDVELTKRCFEQIIVERLYDLPYNAIVPANLILRVESPDDIRIETEDGELVDEKFFKDYFGESKKSFNNARQELIKRWSEENEETRNDIIHIYRQSPKIKTEEFFRDEIERIKPIQYVRKIFDEQAPSIDEIQVKLEQEAEREISSWMFWTLNKKRKEYVETRLESYYQQRVNAYNQRAAQHDDAENKAEVEFNQQSQRRCEERKQRLESLMKGNDIEVLQKEILRVPDVMSLPFQYHADARLDGTAINIYLSLPRPHDLPYLEGVRLASGNYKIKEIPDKNKKKDYSKWIWGIAVYVASNYFNVSPLINLVTIKGHVSIDSDDQFLYDITFDRNTFGSLDFENIDIEQVLSYFSVNGKLSKEVLDKLFALKEPEPRKEAKSAPNNMHDSLFNDAARIIVQEQNGSAALIQRKFQIGYKRAGAIMEQLEEAGIVGIAHGSNPRDVLISNEQELEDIISEL